MNIEHSCQEARRAVAIADTIKPLLAGLGPDLQGAVIGQLLATYLAGYRGLKADQVREDVLGDMLDLVARLVVADDARRSTVQ
jgi:hypothetical protein